MGIIKRQGIKQSAVAYVGAILGLVNTLFIYPFAWSAEELGLVRFVLDSAILLVPFIVLGLTQVSIRFFPNFKNEAKQHNGFFFFLLMGTLVGFSLLSLLYLLFQTPLLNLYADKSILFQTYIPYIVPLAGLMAIGTIFYSYSTNLQRIAVPSIFNILYIKISLPLLALTYFFGYISLTTVVYGILASYLLRILSYLIYLKKLGKLYLKPNFSLFNKSLFKEMSIFGGFSILGALGNFLATKIDTIMVASLAENELEGAGIYSIAFYIANIIMIPAAAIWSISAPIISNAWKTNNIAQIQGIYTKSSINLLIIGLYLLIGIWICIDDLFHLIPNGEIYEKGKYVVLLLGIAKLINAATSMNDHIILYSKYFRFHLFALLVLASFNILANYYLIPIYQLLGAAIATLASLTLFNLIKLIFIQKKMNMQPFTWNTLWVILIGLISYGIVYLVPTPQNPILSILLKGSLITILYLPPIYFLKISPELNNLPKQLLKRL